MIDKVPQYGRNVYLTLRDYVIILALYHEKPIYGRINVRLIDSLERL